VGESLGLMSNFADVFSWAEQRFGIDGRNRHSVLILMDDDVAGQERGDLGFLPERLPGDQRQAAMT
jgi:hypothetical protein